MAIPTVGVPDYSRSVGVLDANQILFNNTLAIPGVGSTPVIDVTRWASICLATPFAATAPYDLTVIWFSDVNQTLELGRKFIGCGGSGNTDHVEVVLRNRGPFVRVDFFSATGASSCQVQISGTNKQGDIWSCQSSQFAGAGAGVYNIPTSTIPNGLNANVEIQDIYQGPATMTCFSANAGCRAELHAKFSNSAVNVVGILPITVGGQGDSKVIYVPPWHLTFFIVNQSGTASQMTGSLIFGQ